MEAAISRAISRRRNATARRALRSGGLGDQSALPRTGGFAEVARHIVEWVVAADDSL